MAKKIVLSIETSGVRLGLAILEFNGRVLAHFNKELPQQQSMRLFPELTRLLKKTKKKIGDIALIAVNVGPGSFTGVRVGVAAARAMAQALDVPLIGISGADSTPEQIANQALRLYKTKKKKFPYAKVVPVYSQPSWAERNRK